MISGKIKNGFKFEIDETKLDDMEFLEALAETQEDPLAFPKVCTKLLGIEQKKRLYDYLRDESGKVPIADVEGAVVEIMTASGEKVKNS